MSRILNRCDLDVQDLAFVDSLTIERSMNRTTQDSSVTVLATANYFRQTVPSQVCEARHVAPSRKLQFQSPQRKLPEPASSGNAHSQRRKRKSSCSWKSSQQTSLPRRHSVKPGDRRALSASTILLPYCAGRLVSRATGSTRCRP